MKTWGVRRMYFRWNRYLGRKTHPGFCWFCGRPGWGP